MVPAPSTAVRKLKELQIFFDTQHLSYDPMLSKGVAHSALHSAARTQETLTEMLRVSVEVEDGDAAGHEAVAEGADLLEAGGEADAAEAGVRVEAEAGEPGAVLAAAEADDDGPRVPGLGLAAVLVLPLHLRTLGRGGQGAPQPLDTTFGVMFLQAMQTSTSNPFLCAAYIF